MIYELPHNHTTILIGQLDLERMATDLIRGHIERELNSGKRPDVLMLGFSTLSDSHERGHESHITFISEPGDHIPSRRYSLIVTNMVAQTTYDNGMVKIEVSNNQHIVLERLSSVGIPFLAIVQ